MQRIIILMLLLCLVGCKTIEQQETKIEYRDRVEYRDRLVRDSVYSTDSVFIFQKGDTIYHKEKQYIYKDKILRDTVAICDTVVKKEFIEKIETVKTHYSYEKYLWIWCVVSLIIFGYFIKRKFF